MKPLAQIASGFFINLLPARCRFMDECTTVKHPSFQMKEKLKMDKRNLALVENLMDEIKTVRDLKRNSVAYDGARSDEKIAQLLMELDDSGAGSQASDELNARRHSAIRPEVGPGYSSRGKVFNTFGEQLQSIHRASQSGEAPDKRLYSVRAATGMSEGIPSDGGSKIKASHGSDAMMNNPQIQGNLNYATA